MIRAIRRCGWFLVVVLAAFLATPRASRAQDTAVRFEISNVGDSTVTFRLGRVTWVRPGMPAIVVDPRRRDILVARVKVLSITKDTASALITGQTTLVARDHLVLLSPPPSRFFRSRAFWGGILSGLATGFVLGKL